MHNIEVRDILKQARVYGYEVAQKLKMAETSFSRMLARSELSEERKQEVIEAIHAIKLREV